MSEWTLGRAVDVCLRAYSEHLHGLRGHCPRVGELTGRDGTVVNLTSVQEVVARAFDHAVAEAAAVVVRPLEVHKKAGVKMAGTRDEGFLGVLLALFSLRPGLATLVSYLNAELKRRAAQFDRQAREIEMDLQAPLEEQGHRIGRKMAFAVMHEATNRYKRMAVHPVVSWN
jgi:hypothetical protein